MEDFTQALQVTMGNATATPEAPAATEEQAVTTQEVTQESATQEAAQETEAPAQEATTPPVEGQQEEATTTEGQEANKETAPVEGDGTAAEPKADDVPAYLKDFEVDLGDNNVAKQETQEQAVKPQGTAPAPENIFSQLSKELGSEDPFSSIDDVKQFFASQKANVTIPGLTPEITQSIMNGEIGLEEVSGDELLDYSVLSADELLGDRFVDLGMSEEDAQEHLDSMSEPEKLLQAGMERERLNGIRERRLHEVRSHRQQQTAAKAQAQAEAARKAAEDRSEYEKSISDNLKGEVKFDLTGETLTEKDKQIINKVLTDPATATALIWGANKDYKSAIQNITMLLKRGQVAEKLIGKGVAMGKKALIDKASNINLSANGQPVLPAKTESPGGGIDFTGALRSTVKD